MQIEIIKKEKTKVRHGLENFFSRQNSSHRYITNDDLLDYLDSDSNLLVEVWSLDRKLMYATSQFAMRTSYESDEVVQNEWNQLFERDEFSTKKILETVYRVAQTGLTIFNITPPHEVSERAADKCVNKVEVKAIGPLFATSDLKLNNEFSELIGFVAVVLFH